MVNFHFPIITAMVSTSVCQFEQQAKFRDICLEPLLVCLRVCLIFKEEKTLNPAQGFVS